MVAIGKVVFTSREHVIALEARDKGLLGVTLRYPYEVRKEEEYFDDIPEEKLPKACWTLPSTSLTRRKLNGSRSGSRISTKMR
jgi:non-homologous end joining protein Ku